MPNKNTPRENSENQKAVLAARTGGALSALSKVKAAKERKSSRRMIHLKDPETGEDMLCFEIRPLSEREYEKARKNAAERLPSGVERRNISKERAELIYMATVDEDKKLWDGPEIRDEFDTNFPRDVIDDVLIAGDKIAIVNAIDELSGFSEEKANVDVVQELKN